MVESIAVMCVTWDDFMLINMMIGTVGFLSGLMAGELKHNREGVKEWIRGFRESMDELVG